MSWTINLTNREYFEAKSLQLLQTRLMIQFNEDFDLFGEGNSCMDTS